MNTRLTYDFSNLRPGFFGFDEGPDYEGFTAGDTWNGWACPLFTADTVAHIAAENEDLCIVTVDEAGVTVDETAFYGVVEGIYTFEAVDTEQGRLYPLGYATWTWQEVDNTP